jgi:hypothetical protein
MLSLIHIGTDYPSTLEITPESIAYHISKLHTSNVLGSTMATPHYTRPMRSHAGASEEDVLNEPDWVITHNHRIGFRNRDNRHPAYTHVGDDWGPEQEQEFLAQAKKEADELNKKLVEHDLITVRDYMDKQEVRTNVSQMPFQSPFSLTFLFLGLSFEVTSTSPARLALRP